MVRIKREDRLSGGSSKPDQRTPFQLDRDRLLYSTEFRRLAGVTQVVSPGEGEIFHSRLTHTLKVAQIGRLIAEMFLADQEQKKYAKDWGGIDPDVVETAALAHDLGHPPFGHLAEYELAALVAETILRDKHKLAASSPIPTELAEDLKSIEGYEGNAQSFHIITSLAVRRPGSPPGLDLTRATLNATLKYPWMFDGLKSKYGAYRSDQQAFDFARELLTPAGNESCVEAQIMDWADDITYSVHDVEDFYRAGRIPLDRLRSNPKERNYFRETTFARRKAKKKPFPMTYEDTANILDNLFDMFVDIEGPYDGTRSRRQKLYELSSKLIHRFVNETKLRKPPGENGLALERSPELLTQVELLKEMIWCYVINNPSLAGHQYGQRQAIRKLFQVLNEAAVKKDYVLFPASFREKAEELAGGNGGEIRVEERARLVADAISSLTDQQALRLYQRFTASAQGSVLDPIVM